MTSITSPTLLVMAAGLGSRYGGLKQLDPVGPSGEIVLDYSVFDAIRARFSRVVFVIRMDIEAAFRVLIGARFASRINVQYVFQELDALPARFAPPPARTKPGTRKSRAGSRRCHPDAIRRHQRGRPLWRTQLPSAGTALRLRLADYAMVGYSLRNTLSEFGTVSRGICDVHRGYLAAGRGTH